MHFWIDKRQTQCYSGHHRVPSSLSAGGVGRSRGRVCASAPGGRKGMAAPVHRFVPVDCAPRRPRVPRSTQPPPIPRVHSPRRTEESSMYVEIPEEPPQQPTIASLAAARSVTPDTLLRTAALALHPAPFLAPHFRLGMLAAVAVGSVFTVWARFYFGNQVLYETAFSETVVVCSAMGCVCLIGCALSVFCPREPPLPAFPPDRVCSTGTRERMPPSEDISLATLLQSSDQSAGDSCSPEAPPPYHIAVLLPGREQASPPPPAYNAIK